MAWNEGQNDVAKIKVLGRAKKLLFLTQQHYFICSVEQKQEQRFFLFLFVDPSLSLATFSSQTFASLPSPNFSSLLKSWDRLDLRMPKTTYLPTFIPYYLPTYLLTYLPMFVRHNLLMFEREISPHWHYQIDEWQRAPVFFFAFCFQKVSNPLLKCFLNAPSPASF